MALRYVYARLPVTLAELAVYRILLENNFNLETLAKDLSEVLLDKEHPNLTYSVLKDDYADFATYCGMDSIEERIVSELTVLIESLKALRKKFRFRQYGYFRAIHLELPSTAVLEYAIRRRP